MKKNKKNKKGFSFIEAIMSVFILSTAMVVILGLMSSNLRNSLDAIDQEIAGFLAQEGVELVRNIRDNNWKNNWDSFDSTADSLNSFPVLGDSTGCRVDMDNFNRTIKDCNNNLGQKKLWVNSDGYYIHVPTGVSTESKFSRKIDVVYTMDITGLIKEYAEITSMVVWRGTDFPSDISGCNTASKCVFTKTTLSTWGE